MGLEAAELARWTRFAAKGGIGKCRATCDCVAESPDDLMFLKDDEITVLLQLQDKEGCYLGYCEGVVGRFSGSDVAFHSKLKKAIMTKRASTNTTLSVHSSSPTPTTPTTPTSMEASATRPSSRRMADELLTIGGGRSSSQNSLGQISPSNSTASSPTPGISQSGSKVRARSTSRDARKTGGLQYGPTSPRGFHLGITATDDSPEEYSAAEAHSPQLGVSVDEMSPTLSSSIILTSPSTPPPVSLGLESLQPSSPIAKENISASLKPPGPLINDPASTAPLRIVKRSPSNPTSPAQSAFSLATTGSTLGSPNTSSNVSPQNETFYSPLEATSPASGDVGSESESMAETTQVELQVSKEVEQQESIQTSLDTSAIADSGYDDLTTSHPGRFSRFSIGDAITIPQLLGLTSHSTPLPISAKDEPQDDSAPSSPQASISKLDGRTSLSIAARGKVDEATLASTQAQVGIGLSLLQDLVGGMSSDSDSDYADSDDEVPTVEGKVVQVGRTSRSAENGHLVGFVGAVGNSTRASVTPSEGSTVQGLTYGDEEEESHTTNHASVNHISPASPTLLPARSPPTTPPVRHQSPRSLSRYTPLQQSPESAALPDSLVRERERRPSVATSVVSGVSGLSRKSGASSSWDGDIYDNYRYSTFSAGSSIAGTRRPSIESARQRTDSVSVAGRKRLESISHIQDVAEDSEEVESADLTGVENQSSSVLDTTNASFYSQDSHLPTLSKEITSLPPNDSFSRQSTTVNRPSPLSIPTLEENANHLPLLHTDWASPTSPTASTVQTALSPPTATIYTPHLRQNTATGVPQMALSEVEDNGTGGGEQPVTGMASIMRKRLEANRQSPMPNEHSTEKEEIERDDVSPSFASDGRGQAIVVEDDEELPSRILANGDDSELCDPDDTFLESHEGDVTGGLVDSPDPKEVEFDVDQDQTRSGLESPSPRTSIGRLAPLFISNRTPSPAMLKDDADTQANSNLTQPGASNSPSPPRRVLLPPSQRPSPPPSLSQSQPSESNTAQLRPRNTIRQERQSLFLPHPNAPKAPANAPLILEPGAGVGVISGTYPIPPRDTSGGIPPSVPPSHMWPPVQAVIRMALSMPPRTALLGPAKSPVKILPTIYGRTEVDLASSIRPVPIMFSVEPPPLDAGRGKATAPRGAVLPRIGAGGPMFNRPNFLGSPPRRPSAQPISNRVPPLPVNPGVVPRVTGPSVPPPPSLVSEGKDKPTVDDPMTRKTETTVDTPKLKTSLQNGSPPLPRSNFTPKAPGLRPRSRSFSGFNSSATPPTNNDKQSQSIRDWPKRSASSSASSPPGLKNLAKPSRPSPLSVSSVNSSGNSSPSPTSPVILGSAPTSPLARKTFVPPPPSPLTTSSSTGTGGHSLLKRPTLTIAPQPATDVPAAASRSTNMIDNNQTVPRSSIGSKPSLEGVSKQAPFPPGTEVSRQSSLRSMISLPNLRRNRTRDDDAGVYDRDMNERRDRPKEMVQVKDTEFELVRPNLSSLQRTSEDSMLARPDNSAESRMDGGLRSESPAPSLNSSDYRSPVVEMPNSPNGLGLNPDAGTPSFGQSNESMEAHRQRETKWVSLMSSSPASLSRKSKKVKKLLVDGVPSSVRYLIWSYLTDGKGRAVKGVYEQLCQRGGVIHTRDIVTDAERLFGAGTGSDGMQYLQATKGAIIVLLQAYFSMVPDVQYTTGLTKIVGQLLLLSPEEDAFWIFTSIMDTHIRPYFTIPAPISSSVFTPTPRSTQMEVDAALYSRALESIDPAVAKKIFVDLGILPGALCHAWFTSLFVGTLPPDFVNRVWDIFLYEGIPFLLRVALSFTIVCRKFILSATPNSESKVLATLARPPPQWLPPTPDAFLALAFGVKLKDDDIRKQRIKMGEQVKRQTQAQQGVGSVTLSGISLPSRV